MATRKKILTVTCEMERPAKAEAIWDGQNLYILDISEATGDPYVWLVNAQADISAKAEAGWVVMAADRTGTFPKPATIWNMNAKAEGDKTNLQEALEMYFALQSRAALILEPHLKKHQIRLGGENDMAYMENDDRGRSVYRVNWKEFRSAHLVLLMCVAGALLEQPLSKRWLTEFVGLMPKHKEPNSWPVFRTMRNFYKSENERIEQERKGLEARKYVRH